MCVVEHPRLGPIGASGPRLSVPKILSEIRLQFGLNLPCAVKFDVGGHSDTLMYEMWNRCHTDAPPHGWDDFSEICTLGCVVIRVCVGEPPHGCEAFV
jgi:hypothetical protein